MYNNKNFEKIWKKEKETKSLITAYKFIEDIYLETEEDYEIFDNFTFEYVQWLINSGKSTNFRINLQTPQNYIWTGKANLLSKKKGIKSLEKCVSQKGEFPEIMRYVYSDDGKLIATNHKILAIINNTEKFGDKGIINPSTLEFLTEDEWTETIADKFPAYKDVIPQPAKTSYTANIANVAEYVGYAIKLSKILTHTVYVHINLDGIYASYIPQELNKLLSVFAGNGCYMFTINTIDEKTAMYMTSCNKCQGIIMPVILERNSETGTFKNNDDTIIVNIPENLFKKNN